MKNISAVLFDLDGTLLDTAPDFTTVINIMLSRKGMAELDDDTVRTAVSHGARGMISLAFGYNIEDPKLAPAVEEFREIYSDNLDKKTAAFPGINELLTQLEKACIPWGIVTNKPVLFTHPLLKSLGYFDRAKSIVCPDDVSKSKPDPESILLACREMNVTPENAIYVGDHERDVQAGQKAGLETIVALYGYIDNLTDAKSWNATHYVESASDIIDILHSY